MQERKWIVVIGVLVVMALSAGPVLAAYHHEGENDSDKFLNVYPQKTGTKLDHCALCHCGGETVSGGKVTVLGSCQWCHYKYGFDGSGPIDETMNPYGRDYRDNGRNEVAVRTIEPLDSDGDTYSNLTEIEAERYPGDPDDDPSKIVAPFRIYTRAQLAAMPQHTQFLLMNTTRSGDSYDEYTGVVMEDLLTNAGVLGTATTILAYAPDGFANSYAMDETVGFYHVRGIYGGDRYYHYNAEADMALNPDYGWCEYDAPSCAGRSDGDLIVNPDGLKMILALKREGAYLDAGVLDATGKLNGEGPFRVVPPQKVPSPPDQSVKSPIQDVVWPYMEDWDHNAGYSIRSATIIKVEPLPAGMTDIDVYEAGWQYIDDNKIVIYGDIDGTDSNGNGILDSEEGADPTADFDGDGIPDYRDTDTATLYHPYGLEKVLFHCSAGDLKDVKSMAEDEHGVPQAGRPDQTVCPYGALEFDVVGLVPGETVTITLVYPDDIPADAKYYKIDQATGWHEIPFERTAEDNIITITLTDGDPETDSDGVADGIISDPGAVTVPAPAGGGGVAASGGGGGGCFISTIGSGSSLMR